MGPLGMGVGVAAVAVTFIVPTIPQQAPCGLQKYEKEPGVGNGRENVKPEFCTPESQRPFGAPGVPEVVL